MGGHGITTKNPFPDVAVDASIAWQKAWPELDYKNTDPIVEAADFYLLQGLSESAFVEFDRLTLPNPERIVRAAITLGVSVEELHERNERARELYVNDPRRKLTEIADEAKLALINQVNRIDPVFKSYIHLACGGELRHHKAVGGKTYSSNRHLAWAGWRAVYDHYGNKALVKMSDLFREFHSSSFGGEKWAVASDLLLAREEGTLGPDPWSNKMLFIDRVFTLEHNGGCFLNKIASHWKNVTGHGIGFLQSTVLNAHCENPPNVRQLYVLASDPVVSLMDRYMALVKEYELEFLGIWDDDKVAGKKQKKGKKKSKPNTPDLVIEDADFELDDEAFVSEFVNVPKTLDKLKSMSATFKAEVVSPDIIDSMTKLAKTLEFVSSDLIVSHPTFDVPIDSLKKFTGDALPLGFFTIHFNFQWDDGYFFSKDYHLTGTELIDKSFYWKHMTKGIDKEEFFFITISITGPEDADTTYLDGKSLCIQAPEKYTKINGGDLVSTLVNN